MYKMFNFNILQKKSKKEKIKRGRENKRKKMCLSCKQKTHGHILAKKKSTALVQLYNIL